MPEAIGNMVSALAFPGKEGKNGPPENESGKACFDYES